MNVVLIIAHVLHGEFRKSTDVVAFWRMGGDYSTSFATICFSSFSSLGPSFPALAPLGSLGPPVHLGPLSLVPKGLLRILEADIFIS